MAEGPFTVKMLCSRNCYKILFFLVALVVAVADDAAAAAAKKKSNSFCYESHFTPLT